MNKQEQLLTILNEESNEVAVEAMAISKHAAKALRFGLDDRYPEGLGSSNEEKLVDELNDLLGAIDMLVAHGALRPDWMSEKKRAQKCAKIERYLEYAMERGTYLGGGPGGECESPDRPE